MQAGSEWFQQRGGLHFHSGGNQVRILDRRDREFRERSGESGWRCAQMKAAGAARTASPTMPERIERDAVADLEVADSLTDLDDFASGLVAEHDRQSRYHALCAAFPI